VRVLAGSVSGNNSHNRRDGGAALSLVSFAVTISEKMNGLLEKMGKRYGYHRIIWENGSREKGDGAAGRKWGE
jgi:hypothetical protein